MSQKQYWQGFGQVNDPESFQQKVTDEFREELPFEDLDEKGLLDAKAPRRDFLKYLGFSTAAATLAASCKMPVRKAIPFANRPENIVPGEAKYYATTYVQDGDAISILAKVRDGRPIKIEGNTLSSYTKGGTSARVQASVLDLYDMYRITHPKRKVGEKFEETTYEFVDKTIAEGLAAAGGAVVLLTSTVISPSTKQVIAEFLAKYPGSKHVQADAVSYSGMLLANEASGFGRNLPTYKFDAAKVIVSLGADFLGSWLNPVENAVGYGKGRKIDEKNPQMSKHYQFEGYLSTTGGSADERFTHRPSETGAVALALLAALDGSVAAPALADAKLKAGIAKVAADLKANSGAGLVVSGSNDVNVQIIVNAINNAIGAYGKTIDWSVTSNYRQGIDKDLVDLVAQMDGGQVGALLIAGANPAYSYFDADKFKSALKKVKLSVSFGEKMDETTELCNYIVPTHHYLESWGDAEPKSGVTSFIQPTIYPLFKTRPFQTSLLKWSGNNTDYDTYFKNYWTAKLGSLDAFDKALQDGIIETAPAAAGTGSYGGGAVASAASAIAAAKKGGKDEVVLYQKVSIGTGAGSANPWLQELPDPISKATWDNYALISMAKANELGIKLDNDYEYYPQKPVIKLTIGNKEVELPILVIPGMNANTIAVAVGYGRNDGLGKTAAGVGKNVYPFASFNGTTIDYFAPNVTVTDQKKKQKIAQTQIHNSYEGRVEVVRETTLATFKKNPNEISDFRNDLKEKYAKNSGDYRKEATLYGVHEQPGIKWGMTVDMNACYGCGACVVACHTENNVPVVGKSEVLRYHDMHWLRIDRYFVSDEKNPDDLKGVVFQPMMCQHCDNAPCENVCPVAATNHSAEGINQMAYNRCIGTRYCANNCPFKVRRFNWADYMSADSFPDNMDQQLVGKLDPVVHQMNDELTRMVLNPDVTVRSRGVMEKCSFCIQRTQAAKLTAKKEGRVLADGDAKTACQQACAGDAIVFGNVHDSQSQVSKIRHDNPQRSFYVLEQLHVLPNVTYLAKVRNTDEIIEKGGHHATGETHEAAVPAGEHKKEEAAH
ncbi:TAT-variant-translocated molybdopterin oxidoreductase [Terrimonas pollutisoli]|uniref:TAT-variant-translocated molybdopterin oxidoreductase n=1 Tax=Terrimonas pollutisoli TaxID=3034147 RepID=UPI0023EAA357|nr:TAT-variant-translocated molybdopterin oxidoreductase [Terrimonas sp. H1YJ31]